jgi:hypothetical protein
MTQRKHREAPHDRHRTFQPSHMDALLAQLPAVRIEQDWGRLDNPEVTDVLARHTAAFSLIENGKVYACGGLIPTHKPGFASAWCEIAPGIGIRRLRHLDPKDLNRLAYSLLKFQRHDKPDGGAAAPNLLVCFGLDSSLRENGESTFLGVWLAYCAIGGPLRPAPHPRPWPCIAQ